MKCLRSVLLAASFLSLSSSVLSAATPNRDAASSHLEKRLPQHGNNNNNNNNNNHNSINTNNLVKPKPKQKSVKYFQEPGADPVYGHYDNRYFKSLVPYEEHRVVLEHLVRSYLLTFRALGIETWLAHGTLLGWWWNGRVMPWDYDLDVQVSDVTLFYLARHFNRTTHVYHYHDPETGEDSQREYLLDINPYHGLPRGDGQNIIDARWIDTTNGMFIDMTSLAERDPKGQPGVLSCKNYHRYRTRELYPLRETEFEGVPALVPYSFDRILTGEYGTKSLVATHWEGHHWDSEAKEWVMNGRTKTLKTTHDTSADPRPTTSSQSES